MPPSQGHRDPVHVVTLPAGDWVSSDCDISRLLNRLSSEKGRKSRFLNHLHMKVPHQRWLGLGLAIFRIILGAFAGAYVGRRMLLRTANADLSDYV